MDKNEIKKTLKQFEEKVEDVFDGVTAKVDEYEVNEAILMKRTVGANWSCASCTKQIFNNTSALAEHQISNRMHGSVIQGKDRSSHKSLAGVSKLLNNYNIQANHLQSQSTQLQYTSSTPAILSSNVGNLDANENPRYSKLKGVLLNVVGGSISPTRDNNAPKKVKKVEYSTDLQHVAA